LERFGVCQAAGVAEADVAAADAAVRGATGLALADGRFWN